jgi:CheY-like chemotaxis protein
MPKSLLLADDSVTIQKVVGISFANEDIEITTVDNGRDAVAKARAIRPDIILADVVMPGMSGYEVCETIKSDPNLRHVPVLLLTGTFEAFDQARASAVGAAGHVAKPFEAQTLVDRVKQLLASAPAATKAAARPAAAPAPVPAAAPAPAMGGDDDAFDFFSDAPEQPAAAGPPPVPSGDALDFDDPDGAFAFGDDDLADDLPGSRSMPTVPASRRPDATIAMLPDPPSASEDAFDFSFDRPGGGDVFDEPMEPDQLAHTTLLDPAAGSGFDVSSSDLEVSRAPAASFAQRAQVSRSEAQPSEDHWVGERRPAESTQILAIEDADPLTEPESAFAPAHAPRAPAHAFDDSPDPFETTIPPFRAARREVDPFESDPFEDSPIEVGEPLRAGDDLGAEDPFTPESALAEPALAEPWEEASFEAPAAPEAPMPAVAAASEVGRAELHDMLEKIAWDSFAPVTEKIVREAIAKIEQVVWEVVPKLAETLIQEEIRKLKGGS